MEQSIVELATELTMALIQKGNISPENIHDTLQQTYATLASLKVQEETGSSTTMPIVASPPPPWRKSIMKHTVSCLECGQTFKQLSIRHLGIHGLDSRSYRIKYGIPRTQALAARSTTERRRQVVQQSRPWEKAPAFLKGQAHDGTASPEIEAEALPEEAEETSAAAPAQQKRQRKTSPKKTARKKSSQG
jgi:predicted transcriptional regulator